jgi:hypothetical protein
MLKLLGVLRKYVSYRGYIKFSRKSLHKPEHALPEQILPRQVYALWEVIYFLIFIKLLDISSLDIAGPKNVPFGTIIE